MTDVKANRWEEVQNFIASIPLYRLVEFAECMYPAHNSEGAQMLTVVRDSVADLLVPERDDEDLLETIEGLRDGSGVDEIADNAPNIYTWTMWHQFIDLGAWQEDIDELIGDSTDMNQMAAIALYTIAERLTQALLDTAKDFWEPSGD